MYLRCIQCEIQNALGGALTNVCVAGMTLLKPMVTMVSYVVGERDNALLRPSADADQMLAEIQVGVLDRVFSSSGQAPGILECRESFPLLLLGWVGLELKTGVSLVDSHEDGSIRKRKCGVFSQYDACIHTYMRTSHF